MKITFIAQDDVPHRIILTAEGQAENAQLDCILRPHVVRNGPIIMNTDDDGNRQAAVRLDPSPE